MSITPLTYPAITASLIADFKNGSEQAFKEIFTTYDSRLLGYAQKICVTRQDAEEVIQDVFTSLWQHRASITQQEITGWLIKVCRNKSLKSLRRHVLQVDLDLLPELPEAQLNPLQQLYFQEIEQQIRAVIETLPPVRKKIFLMSRDEEMTYQQIADELGISVFTVKKQMSKALEHLRGQLTPYAYTLLLLLSGSIN